MRGWAGNQCASTQHPSGLLWDVHQPPRPPRLRTGSRQEAGRAPGRLCPVAAQSLSLTGLLGPEEQVFRNCRDCVREAPPRPYHGLLHPLRDQPEVCDAALSKHDPTRNWVGPGSGKQTSLRNRYHRRPPNTAAEPPHPRDAPQLSLGSLHAVPIGALASSCNQNRLVVSHEQEVLTRASSGTLCSVKARHKQPHVARFHLQETPQRANPQRQKVGEWLPGLGEGAWGVAA